jgi:hypothetical protein
MASETKICNVAGHYAFSTGVEVDLGTIARRLLCHEYLHDTLIDAMLALRQEAFVPPEGSPPGLAPRVLYFSCFFISKLYWHPRMIVQGPRTSQALPLMLSRGGSGQDGCLSTC